MLERQLFLNLAVRDLERSKVFFDTLGFEFKPEFTSDDAACMILGRTAFVMLVVEARLKDFTTRALCDTTQFTEATIGYSCMSREEVDRMVHTAIEAGGQHGMPAQDHAYMYGWSFYDLDGHHWEPFWMDLEAALPG